MEDIYYAEAIRRALLEEMRRDERMIIMGTGVGKGGTFKTEEGLFEEFGENRLRGTPISEAAIIGTALGAAMTGMRVLVEISWNDFLCCAMDQIVNHLAKMRWVSSGQIKVPVVIRTSVGHGRGGGQDHAQSLIALFMHIPGLKVVVPSTPYDVKGLLKTALRDECPVMFFEDLLSFGKKGPVPEKEYTIPFGVADIKRKGEDATVVAISAMVGRALNAAKKLENEGVNIEIIDPRTLVPMDKCTIIDSVKKTGRAIIVESDCKTGGVGAEIASIIVEEAFDYLDAPIKRLACLDTPMPASPPLERYILPSEDDIIRAVKQIL